MLLKTTENIDIGATVEDVWKLLNDTPRLATLVPGVEEAFRVEPSEQESYRVRVTEKVGPFKVTMKLEVAVFERVALAMIGSSVKGGDAAGLGRATGTVRVELNPSEIGTSMAVGVDMEILGKLATLGAPVVRRRVTELFAEFGRRVVSEFQAVEP